MHCARVCYNAYAWKGWSIATHHVHAFTYKSYTVCDICLSVWLVGWLAVWHWTCTFFWSSIWIWVNRKWRIVSVHFAHWVLWYWHHVQVTLLKQKQKRRSYGSKAYIYKCMLHEWKVFPTHPCHPHHVTRPALLYLIFSPVEQSRQDRTFWERRTKGMTTMLH